jgi:hypothetical protein
VPDTRNGRWLLLDNATIAATIGPDAPALKHGGRGPTGADHHGNVIVASSLGGGIAPMPNRDSLLLLRVARATGTADTLTRMKSRPATVRVEGPADRPTSVSVLMNPLSVGEAAALFHDRWVAVARLDPYRVDWITAEGKRVIGQPLPFERVRLDDREKTSFVERQAVRSGRAARDPSSFPEWPEYVPPFLTDALLTAPDGRLWIRRTATSSNADPPYDVIDRNGRLVARVAAGKDVQVVGFGRNAVYTVFTDDSGIQTLQRRPIPRL